MRNIIDVKKSSSILFNDDIKDVAIDFAEIGIDAFIENDTILEAIPMLKSIIGTYKSVICFRDWFDFKKTYAFWQQFHKGDVDVCEIERRKKAYENNDKWFLKEIETIVIFLSRYDDIVKAKLEAEIYIDFINRVISEQEFKEYLAILDRLFIDDIKHLEEIYQKEKELGITEEKPYTDDKEDIMAFNKTICERLVSMGLLIHIFSFQFGSPTKSSYLYTRQGEYICNVSNSIRNKS